LRVTRREHEAGTEVLEPRRVDPGVVALERVEPHPDRGRAEELGERGRDRFDPRPRAGEVHVGVDRVAHSGHDAPLGLELLALDAERLAEPQPGFDAARLGGGAVVIDDARDPLAPDLDLGAVGQDCGVLERNAALVVEPIRDPALQLRARELAGVHALVEGVQVVVARALRAQALDELLAHSSTSRPS